MLSYRLAYGVVTVVAVAVMFAALAIAGNDSPVWALMAPVIAFLFFPRKLVAERLATKDRKRPAH